MIQCHECGCEIPPGDAVRREVVLSTSTSSSPHGGATHVQKGMVSLCPKCVPVVDERLRKDARSSAIWTAVIIGAFVAFIAGGYFLVVKPNMEEHERFRKQMDEDFEKTRKQQQEFMK